MGIFGWLRPEDDEEDRSLIEVSNDAGDHWVADIPAEGVQETERALRDAGVEEDNDDLVSKIFGASRIADRRDSEEYRYRSARVVDEDEDLEDSHDQENDTSDYEDFFDREDDTSDFEESEQPAEGGWFSWW
jgi:hypothetical protein